MRKIIKFFGKSWAWITGRFAPSSALAESREEARKLRLYALELERSNRELQDFASVAAHDLQEPLRKVKAFGDLLQAELDGQLHGDAADYLSRMRASAGRMQALIEDLLSYSRLANKDTQFADVDLAQVLEEVRADLELLITAKSASLESRGLPVVHGDATLLRQLFQNLIANALKFSRTEPSSLIRIEGRTLEGAHEISVKDNGIGFDNKYADKIFIIFQRLHGRGEYEGNGVGLAVCRRIVERHGGSIQAFGKPGQGAEFKITIPQHSTKASRP